MLYSEEYLNNAIEIIKKIDKQKIEKIVKAILNIRKKHGRLFVLGIGGSAANASHAVNDFRKICSIEAYAPTDNVSELSARTNDEGWQTVFKEWLRVSNLNEKDGVLVFSVGGGDKNRNISPNLVDALIYAREKKAKTIGIVGRDGGYTAQVADECIIIPVVNPGLITPLTESIQLLIEHFIVSHPILKINQNKWESCEKK